MQREITKGEKNITGQEKRILFITSVGHFLSHFYVLVFPALVMSLAKDMDLKLEDAISLSFFMYLLFGAFAVPAGIITDRWRASRMLQIFMIGGGLASAAVSFAHGKYMIMLTLALVGLFSSMYHPAGLALISRTISQRGKGLGINAVAGSFGIAVTPFIVGILVSQLGWRAAYATLGSIGALFGIVSYFIPLDESPLSDSPGDSSRSNSASSPQANSKFLVNCFLILCFAMMLTGFVYRGNTIILPAYFELKTSGLWKLLDGLKFIELKGTKTLAATTLASLVYLMGTCGQYVGGLLADRYDLRKLYLLFHLIAIPFLCLMGALNENLLLICAGIYVFFGFGMQPIENSLVAGFTPSKWRSMAYGIKFILTFGVGGGLLAVRFVSLVKSHYEISYIYYFLACAQVCVVLTIIVLILYSRWTKAEK